eukprot:6126009-Amphidinium_carterae.1
MRCVLQLLLTVLKTNNLSITVMSRSSSSLSSSSSSSRLQQWTVMLLLMITEPGFGNENIQPVLHRFARANRPAQHAQQNATN